MRPTDGGQCRRAGKGGRRPPAWPPGGSPREAGGRAPQAGKPTPKRPKEARSGIIEDAPRRQAPQGMPGVQPGKSGVAALAAREAAPDGALRGAQGAKPTEGPPAHCRRDCPHRLPHAQTQSRCAIHKGNQGHHFSAHWAQKNRRSGSGNQLGWCPPACRRAALASRQMRRYAPCSACRRDSGLPRSIRATVRAETFRPASARVAAICSAS